MLFVQRLDIAAVTHDHGADITKAMRLSAAHSFLCVDHELDLTVQAGIHALSFATVFNKCANIVSILRNNKNLYRRLRDEQVHCVCFVSEFCSSIFCAVGVVELSQCSYGNAINVCHYSLAIKI